MKQRFHTDLIISRKGQLTLPIAIRKVLGVKRKVRVALSSDGTVTLRPLTDVMSFFGSLKGELPFDPRERQKARKLMGRKRP